MGNHFLHNSIAFHPHGKYSTRKMRPSAFLSSLLLGFLVCHRLGVALELSEDDVEEIIDGREKDNEKAVMKMERLKGRTSSFSRGRRRLPMGSGNIFKNARAYKLECGSTYDISSMGYTYFKMNSYSSCYHAFLGSRSAECQVGILCDGNVMLKGPTSGGCVDEYMKLSDGTTGLMVGCGHFTFKGTPRYALNNGTDIYLYYKAVSQQACVAFCIEDLDSGHDVNPPCGKRKDFGRIVGGDDAFKFEFPWIGAVVFRNYANYGRIPFCGGALINDRYFISAAHCFKPQNLRASSIQIVLHAHVMDKRYNHTISKTHPAYQKIPGWNLPQETDASEESLRIDIEEIINHPKFSIETYDWDIAILKLKSRINLATAKVSPICLPRISEFFDFHDGDIHVVAGWGRPAEDAIALSRSLQKLEVPFANHALCEQVTAPTKRHICAGYLEGGKDSCSGDSGGPLIYKFKPSTNQYVLSGVVSAGEGCAWQQKLGVYTNTQDVIQWIYHHTSDGVWCDR